jgi:cytoskeletal protein RodZ
MSERGCDILHAAVKNFDKISWLNLNFGMNQKNLVVIGLIAVFGIAGVLLFISLFSGAQSTQTNNSNSSTTSTNSSTDSSAGGQNTTSTTASSFKDGEYSAQTTYNYPAGVEDIEVKITLKDGMVTALSNTFSPATPQSELNQGNFQAAINSQVIGKKIDDLKLSRVGGASLTTGGFNKSLEIIKQKARQ